MRSSDNIMNAHAGVGQRFALALASPDAFPAGLWRSLVFYFKAEKVGLITPRLPILLTREILSLILSQPNDTSFA